MADVIIRDPKTGEQLGKVNDEQLITEISEIWKAKKSSKPDSAKQAETGEQEQQSREDDTKTSE